MSAILDGRVIGEGGGDGGIITGFPVGRCGGRSFGVAVGHWEDQDDQVRITKIGQGEIFFLI